MNKPFLTVFTPAYNRAYTLPRTYESMKQQKNTDFIWLIVDDGSSDNTAELVKQWQAENNGFEIRYIYKENGGMHTAHNTAYENIHTELNTCIDSDDKLAPGAVRTILDKWEQVRDMGYAGIIALDSDFDGNVIVTTWGAEKNGVREVENEYTISPADFIMLLNLHQYLKETGNPFPYI